ncbi:splicing factor 3B subunit 4 isoform X2 [Lates calcarifer]|uniref:Splicing factor 3B subunit 4 isoform X2 n=1 Tax=Lates calcarifer TaxID=8187 RepID=A0AAJ7LQS1_LATCA|nr:splicing factor 3B subunit 4 isoform X2 [Lates calcarifer]
MDADTEEKLTETSKTSKDESERPVIENKSRGRGVKGRGRGGWMSRGGLRGGRGMMKGFGPPGHGRGRMKDGAMNGLAPMRGMGRMRPYPDLRGHHRGRGGPMGMGPPPPPPPPPPPMHLRGPFPPMPRHGPPPPPPPGHPGFRGRPPHPRGRGMPPPGPPRHFHPRGPRGGGTQYS